MKTAEYSLTWLRCLPEALPETLREPADTARLEADTYLRPRGQQAGLRVDEPMGEGFRLARQGDTWQVTGGRQGVLYGVYALIRCLEAGIPASEGEQRPAYPLRMLNAWDNMSGRIERGYAGDSLWFEDGEFSYQPRRIRQLGRMLASVGVNVLCLNNVNVAPPADQLTGDLLPDLAAFAALLRPFGVRLMVSVDFSMPARSPIGTADPLDPRVAAWWSDMAERMWKAVPDLAGFLVKADSEHRPGPNTYGRTHAEGANMLARAVAPWGGVLVWRCFVYNCMQDWRDTATDRPRAAYDCYHPLDGQFDDNVILQVKNGPYDFQVREPLSPLLLGMERTRLALEVQLAQEYTGHQIDLFAMPPLWRELFDRMGRDRVQAVAAVSNLGRDASWFGHPFAALNLFAFGLFAWDPGTDPEQAVRQWIRCTYGLPRQEEDSLARLLLRSASVYEKYTAPLGLCWMVAPETHYGPSPYGYEFQKWGTYNRADRDAVGIDRTRAGTGYTAQYPPEVAGLYEDPATCPDELLLFFHRLPYGYVMRDGRTLIQRIYDDHFEGALEAEAMRDALEALPLPEPDRQLALERMDRQVLNAREWRDVVNTFFYRFSGVPDRDGRTIYR